MRKSNWHRQGGEVLVKIAAAGLCRSDLSGIDGSRPRPMPMALGHDAAALVVESGAEVDDVARGDHLVLVYVREGEAVRQIVTFD